MRFFDNRCSYRYLIMVVIMAGALTFCPMATATATDTMTPEDQSTSSELSTPEDSRPGPLGLGVSGASVGITTDYFEETVIDALTNSGIFSEIDHSKSAGTAMKMLRVRGVFAGNTEIGDTPYFLNIRIISVDTPSFSISMTVGMDVIWTLYRTADQAELWREKIHSTYTGGMFEGGIHGANRVRVAMEGATRENVSIGTKLLESVDFDRPLEPEPDEDAGVGVSDLSPGDGSTGNGSTGDGSTGDETGEIETGDM